MTPAAAGPAPYTSDRSADRNGIAASGSAGGELEIPGLEEFTHLLARAVRQCRTYPAASPLCAEAIAACRAALAARVHRECIVYRVHPRELIVDDTPIGAGTIVEHELSRRLHRAHVASLRIDATASARDLTRFCLELSAQSGRDDPGLILAEALTERGVERIVPDMARPPEVFDLGAPDVVRQDLVRDERERRSGLPAPARVAHLYPPDRGWIRLDPAVAFTSISLSDLALLADSPDDLASMLLRLTDDGAAAETTPQQALVLKFSDVATVFASLDPRTAGLMFARLANAVLALDTERRTDLLQRTILPGLLDGRLDGRVLHDFPDVDLAGALCLLLDLETAAPEVLGTALDRLELPPERRAAVVPLLDEGLQYRRAALPQAQADSAERYARRLIQMDAGRSASFADFAAFDLHLDEEAQQAIAGVRDGIGVTDPIESRLHCLAQLVRIEPNPEQVQRFLAHAFALLTDLERQRRWSDVAGWVGRIREAAEALRAPRPDVSETIESSLGGFFTPVRVAAIVQLYDSDQTGRDIAGRIVRAAGAGAGSALAGALASARPPGEVRTLTQLLCDHASLLAPALVAALPACPAAAARVIVRVLGHAGAGHEAAIASQLKGRDEQTVREALRALARIGTAEAAALVAARLVDGTDQVRAAAEEALWHFPSEAGLPQVRALLERKDFVRGHPQAAVRLLERAARAGATGLQPVLAALAPLRFHVWSPARARIGQRAHRLLAS